MLASKGKLIFFGVIFAVFFTFYYTFALHILPLTSGQSKDPIMQAIFTLSIVISMLVSIPLKKSLGVRCLYLFFAMAPILTSLMFLVHPFILRLLLAITSGASLGITQLAFLGIFWKSFPSNHRGLSASIIVFVALPIYFVISPVLTAELDVIPMIFVTLIMFIIAFLATWRIKNANKINRTENFPEKRTIILYTIPWIIFSFINATFSKTIASQTQNSMGFAELIPVLSVLQIIGALTGCLVGGRIVDQLGRRPTLAVSITLYGISMAISGISFFSKVDSSFLYFSFLTDGLSWGIILTSYIFVIWGDLANTRNYLSLYAIGLSVFFASSAFAFFPIDLSASISTLVGCALIFLCNIPLALAPELLPPESREKSQMDNYLKKIQKVAKDLSD